MVKLGTRREKRPLGPRPTVRKKGDHEDATDCKDAVQFGQARRGVRHMLEHAGADHDVEALIVEWQQVGMVGWRNSSLAES